MSKIRIYELAKQLGVANKDLVAKINSIGIEAKSHMAMLTEEEAAKVTALYQPKKEEPKKDAPKKDAPKQNQPKQNQPKQNQPKQDGQKKENDRRQDGNRPAQKKDNRNESSVPNSSGMAKAEATKAETKTSRARAIITIIITSRAVRITRAHSSRARRTTIKARTKKTKRATRTVRR